MFAALELLELGMKPVIFERGKQIEHRDIDVQRFINDRMLNTESNIQFGEGGAGSYSDGKLFSRTKNTAIVNKVLETYVKFGAPQEIVHMRKPHLGTDVLCSIVVKIRNYILENGGQIHYNSKMTDIIISNGEAFGVIINETKEYLSSRIYLAVGHSARDVFHLLYQKGVTLEQKAISVGVRIEHPAEVINTMRAGTIDGASGSAAKYSLRHTDKVLGRSISAFCMCPGGEVVNAASVDGHLVLNGMSYYARDSAYSNAAIIVTCTAADYPSDHPLAGIRFQEGIEQKAFAAGGGNWMAPAQNLIDFLDGRSSTSLNCNSFKMGTVASNMTEIFPDYICMSLKTAFNYWKDDYPLFISEQAILLAAETRTSCPVKISRGEDFASINTKNLIPIGEGSGFTGGITSSAMDAIRAVRKTIST